MPMGLGTSAYPWGMGDSPAVSILLPVRDAGAWLGQCRASLERQRVADHEIVAVNDGSTDGSAELLDAWARADRRVRVLSPGRVGLVAALNLGLAACQAEIVARIDADDVAHPRWLERCLERFGADPAAAVVSCRVRFFPRSRLGRGFVLYERWLNGLVEHGEMERERFVESPLPHPGTLYRRHTVLHMGGYREGEWPEDHELWLRLFEAGVRFAKVPEPLLFQREHGARLTRTDPRYGTRAFLRLKARYLVRGPLAGGRPAVLWGAGPTGRRLASELAGNGALLEAFVDIDPRKIGRRVRDLPVLPPESVPALAADGAVILAAVASRGARRLI
ncbi:MAG TPA: glycosyltransferase, partial [Acidobacteria bacterium]|nr:glycosyltransferase [Acidobacteriota bacterium]